MNTDRRPLSPFMIGPYYKPQMTSIMSITHRATGVFLSVIGAPLFLWWIIATAGGAESFAVRATSAGPPGLLFRGQPLADVSVSLSHSADWIAAGLARGGRLGIDVERENPRRRIAAMADWMGWRDCHEADAFYGAWTYREARIKCSGEAPPAGAALLPPEVGVSAGRHHALRLRPMPGVHGCLLVETVTALSLSWSEVDADGLATWS